MRSCAVASRATTRSSRLLQATAMHASAQPSISGLGPCCISGTVAAGRPQGSWVKLGGVATYLARPAEPTTRGVVIATDLFGPRLPNTQLIADALAKEGFLTAVPDLFNNQAIPASAMDILITLSLGERPDSPQPWWIRATLPLRTLWRVLTLIMYGVPFAARHLPPVKKAPIIQAAITDLQSDHGVKSVGVVGYCYGGPAAFKLAATDAVQAFVVAHSRIRVPDDLTPLKAPGLIIFADNDAQCPPEVIKQVEEELGKRTDVAFRTQFYPGTYHGFATRGDDKDARIAAAKEDALKQTIEWLQGHLP